MQNGKSSDSFFLNQASKPCQSLHISNKSMSFSFTLNIFLKYGIKSIYISLFVQIRKKNVGWPLII